MSSVNNVTNANPVQKIVTTPIQKQVPSEAPKQVRVSDRVELSAGQIERLNNLTTAAGERHDEGNMAVIDG